MGEASDAGKVACPNCGKKYRWKADIAGRKVRCKCGQKMRLPDESGGMAEPVGDPNEASTYDLELNVEDQTTEKAAPSPMRAAITGRCPECDNPVKPDAVICVNCGFNIAAGTKLQTEIASADDEDKEAKLAQHAAQDLQRLKSQPGAAGTLKDLEKRDARNADTGSTQRLIVSLVLLFVAAVSIILSVIYLW